MMVSDKQVSVRQDCKIVSLPRSNYRHRRKAKDDAVLIEALGGLVTSIRLLFFGSAIIGYAEVVTNAITNDCYRVYKLLNLNIRRRIKQRLPQRVKQP